MNLPENTELHRGHYFMDEAGDATLFNAKGQDIIGKAGCSRFSMLGLLDVKDPEALTRACYEL